MKAVAKSVVAVEILPMPQPEAEVNPHVIHIVVEVDGAGKPVTFDHSPVLGREIRERAAAPVTDDLTRIIHGKPSGGNIGLSDKVEIANGDHFLALPTGTVS